MSTPKRRGRPRVDPTDQSVPLQIRVPSKDYDASVASARRERVTLGDWIRQTIRDANAPKKAF